MRGNPANPARHKALHVFALGLLVRLAGVLLIWAGDGHSGIFSKVVVVVGVMLSVGGIAVLKWLAMQPRRRSKRATQLPRSTPLVNSSLVTRTIRVGGMSKQELLDRLVEAKVELNESARVLFGHEKFTTSPAVMMVQVVEVCVGELGLAEGGTSAEVYERAAALGLALCPLELGPHLRLQYLDQPEGAIGQARSRHCAPPGSLTVASAAIDADERVPKGFYLRRIEGVLWLRGYRCGAEHVWSAGDRFVFLSA